MPCLRRKSAVPPVATTVKPRSSSRFTGSTIAALSGSLTDTNTTPSTGTLLPAPSCDLAKARPKSESSPMTSPVEFISGPRMMSTPGKRANGKTASLTATCLPRAFLMASDFSDSPTIRRAAILGDRQAGRLGDERHGAAGARVDLEHVDLAVLDRVLHVHQADDLQRLGHRLGLALDLGQDLGRQRMGRQRAGRVAGMDAGLLDMLHDAGDEDVLVLSASASTSTSMASLQVGIDQHRIVARDLHRVARVALAGPRGRRRSPWPGRPARRTGG